MVGGLLAGGWDCVFARVVGFLDRACDRSQAAPLWEKRGTVPDAERSPAAGITSMSRVALQWNIHTHARKHPQKEKQREREKKLPPG